MKRPSWKTYALWIVGVEAVGALSGFLTRDGAEIYSEPIRQPPLSPPAIVFPIVWGILFLLMGVSAARIYAAPASPDRTRGLRLFAIQLAFNFFWTLIFFNLGMYLLAFFWLLALIALVAWMILRFRTIDRTAALLQVPYLLWLIFAGYLNLSIVLLN